MKSLSGKALDRFLQRNNSLYGSVSEKMDCILPGVRETAPFQGPMMILLIQQSSIFKIIVQSIQPEDWSGGRKHQEILTGSDKFQRRFRPRNKKRDFDRTQSLFSKSRIYSNPENVTSSTEDP